MGERGLGYIADVLVFALLLSTATLLLARASPVDPRAESTRYAASFAQSTLLSLQQSTSDQLGGFEYGLDTSRLGLNVLAVGDSVKRGLRHKTIAQLIAEDALLNLRVEAYGTELSIRREQGLDEKLKEFLKGALDQIIGGRFCYRLCARTKPIDLESARVHFETEIEDMAQARTQLCSETVMFSLPLSQTQLVSRIQEVLGVDSFGLEAGADPIIEVTLELWSG